MCGFYLFLSRVQFSSKMIKGQQVNQLTDFKEQQELSYEHQWQRFSCASKVPPSDAAEGGEPS